MSTEEKFELEEEKIIPYRQITTLYKNKEYKQSLYSVFIRLLKFYICPKEIITIIDKAILNSEDDVDIYQKLQKIVTTIKLSKKKFDDSCRHMNRVRDINQILQVKNKIKKYLDFGGGDGKISHAVGSIFSLQKSQIVSVDISPITHPDITSLTLKETDLTLPFQNEEFDLITCFQSLHHMSHIENRISEIKRILKPGGYVIIREHDCINSNVSTLIDIEHFIFDAILSEMTKEETINLFKTYHADYKNRFQWTTLFNKVGLQYVPQFYPSIPRDKNTTRFYYAMYTTRVTQKSN